MAKNNQPMKDEAFEIRHLRMEIKRETACAQQAEDCGNHELAKAYRDGLEEKKKRLKELVWLDGEVARSVRSASAP